jgi:isopenicillin N synthase-like dioxygenase
MELERAQAAARQVLDIGLATIPLTPHEQGITSETIRLAREFFAHPTEVKLKSAAPDHNNGYRAIGREYSQDPARPDLNESFSIWGRGALIPYDLTASQISNALLFWQATLSELALGILNNIRRSLFSPSYGGELQVYQSSYAQVNHYVPVESALRRELLQDVHEDGHLVTLLVSAQPGLEVSRDIQGPFHAITPSASRLVIMPGSALTAVSSNAIGPLFHRVRNLSLAERFSLMYFVNPDISRPVYSWNPDDAHRDLAPSIAAKPQEFGLPSVPS